LQSYDTAQLIQYGKIRVKYHTANCTNTLYDPSLMLAKDFCNYFGTSPFTGLTK